MLKITTAALAASLLLPAMQALAQSDSPTSRAEAEQAREPRRYRIALGPQLVPSFPGSDGHSVRPLVDFSSARGDAPFAFEAPDESFGFPVVDLGGVQFGTALGVEGGRKFDGVALGETDTAFELGGFAQLAILPELRARVEVRRGLGGHKAWVGTAGLDLIARSGDRHVFSIGPRARFAVARYQRAYFGVTPGEAAATGLSAYRPGGGIHAVGATVGYLAQVTDRWGIYSYAKYDRLIGDAADSPVVRQLGSRDQFSGGLGLSYTFGGAR